MDAASHARPHVFKGRINNQGQALLQLMDDTEAGQRWRPLRVALAAAVADSADALLDVAPEVRKPAQEILAYIAPNLLPPQGTV